MSTVKLPELPDANDSWALVELYRWQYGVLPGDKDDKPANRPLSIPEAMKNMAKALTGKPSGEMPHPMNVASVLIFAASRLVKVRSDVIDEAVAAAKNCLHEAPTAQQDGLMDDVVNALTALKKRTNDYDGDSGGTPSDS